MSSCVDDPLSYNNIILVVVWCIFKHTLANQFAFVSAHLSASFCIIMMSYLPSLPLMLTEGDTSAGAAKYDSTIAAMMKMMMMH